MANLKQGGGVNQSLHVQDGGLDFYDILFTPSAEGANATDAFDVTCQLVPKSGTRSLKKQLWFLAWVGADGGAATAYASAVITGFSIQTGVLMHSITATRFLAVAPDVNGTLVIRVTETSGAHTRYLFLATPDGRIASVQLTWA